MAQARLAYALFADRFSGPRWEALAAKGARVQRPLWASTSTKNPAYPDLAYVDTLIGPDTVNTMPDGTVADFLDHGTVARTVDADLDAARSVIDRLAAAGIDMEDVAAVLETEGVASFAASFDDLMDSLDQEGGRTDRPLTARSTGPADPHRAARRPAGTATTPPTRRSTHEDRNGRTRQDGRQHGPAARSSTGTRWWPST